MTRLLSIQPVAERGGSDHAQVEFLRSLPADEFELHVATPADPPLRSELEQIGVTVHIIPMRRISGSYGPLEWLRYALGWPVAVIRLIRLIRQHRIDVVHTNSMHSWYGWAAALMTRRPHIWHAREIVTQSGAALRVERALMRRFAQRVIAMSNAIAAQLHPSNVTVIYERADPARFSPTHAGSFRSSVNIPDEVPLVLLVGRMDTWKGFEVALDAWPSVRVSCPTAHLAIVGLPVAGKEAFAQQLRDTADGLDGVHMVGARSDMPAVYADVDVVAVPSTDPEPYGLVVVEGLASGARIVATNHGGPPEILEHTLPDSGSTVPPRDPAALASAIIQLLPAASSTAERVARQNRCLLPPPPFAELIAGL